MAYWQNIKYKSDAFWTDKDKEILKKNAEATQKWVDAQTEEEKDAAREIMRKTQNALTDAAFEALALYAKDIKGDYDRLLSDVKDMIEQIEPDMVIDETCDAYRNCLQERIVEELREKGAYNEPNTDTQELEIYKQIKERRDRLEKVNDRMMFTAISAGVRHFYLYEQYEAARYAFENQHENGHIYPKRTIDDFRAFTVKTAELADEKIKQIIDERGGCYEIIAEYYGIQRTIEPAAPAARKRPIIPTLIKSDRYSLLNNKIANKYSTIQDNLFRINADGQLEIVQDTVEVVVSNKKSVITVSSIVSLNYTGELSGKLAKLTGYDKAVMNTICTLYLAGNKIITISSIFKTMNGNTTKEPRKTQRDKLTQSLTKLNNHIISINFSSETGAGFLDAELIKQDERISNDTITGRLIEFRVHNIVTTKGNEIDAVQILAEPTLLTYSLIKKNKQIVTIPAGMLNIESVSITDDVIVIKEYLAKQAKLMVTGKPKRSSKILLDTICSECDLTPKNPVEAKRIRDTITKILDEWKDKGYISGYTINKKGKTIEAFTLKVNESAFNDLTKEETDEG